MNKATEAFERATVEDLAEGVVQDPQTGEQVCLVCGKGFPAGEVFPAEGRFFEARAAARLHVEREHGPQFHFLLGLLRRWEGCRKPSPGCSRPSSRGMTMPGSPAISASAAPRCATTASG